MYDPLASFGKRTLSNGLDVYFLPVNRPWTIVEFIVHAGAHEDPIALPGLAHFVEHCASNNVENSDATDINDFFRSVGGNVNFGITSYETTKYGFKIPNQTDFLVRALSFFGQMLLESQLKKGIEKERSIIVREFNERYPFELALNWLMARRKALFKGNRFATFNRPLGRPEGIKAIDEKDLQSFYDRYYVPANISVIVAGGFTEKQIIKAIENSAFGKPKNGLRNELPTPFENFINPSTEEQLLFVKFSELLASKVDQSSYRATWAFPVSFPRKDRLIFSGMLRELLEQEIRVRGGLTYGVNVAYDRYHDVGEYEIGTSIDPKLADSVESVVECCIHKLADSLKLFEKKLEALKASHFMYDVSVRDIINDASGDLQTYQRIISLEEDYCLYDHVSFENVNKMISLLSKERQHTFLGVP